MADDFWGQVQGGYRNSIASPTSTVGTPNPNSYWDDYFKKQSEQTIQTPQYQTANQDQARVQQQQVIQDLQRQAMGNLDSQAQRQLRQGYSDASAQQASLGSTMRGTGHGGTMRSIQQGQQGIQRGFAGDQQMLKAQEQQAAQAMLAQLLAQQQGQDINQAQGMAQGQIQGASQLDAYYRSLLGGALESGIAGQQNALQRGLAEQGFDLENNKINQGLYQDLINSAATATATAGQMYARQNNSSGYRQVDGQDSIVPYWDK